MYNRQYSLFLLTKLDKCFQIQYSNRFSILFIDYTQKGTIFNTMNWTALFISLLFVFSILFYIWFANKKIYKAIIKKRYGYLHEDIRRIDSSCDISIISSQINSIILSNTLQINSNFIKSKIANELLLYFENNKIDIPEWEKYNIPKEIITEIDLIIKERNKKLEKHWKKGEIGGMSSPVSIGASIKLPNIKS